MKTILPVLIATALIWLFWGSGAVKTKGKIAPAATVPKVSMKVPARPIEQPVVVEHNPTLTPNAKNEPVELSKLDLTPTESAAVEEAESKEIDWLKEREAFLFADLGLSSENVRKLSELRISSIKNEGVLLEEVADSEEARENIKLKLRTLRLEYVKELEKRLGRDGNQKLEAFYRRYWGLNTQSPLSASHLPWL